MLLRTRGHWREEEDYVERALKLLAFLRSSTWPYAEAQSLPYGLQRMVEIARALATRPVDPAAGRAGRGRQPERDRPVFDRDPARAATPA